MIFEDIRKNAEQIIQAAVEEGKAAAEELIANPDYPYAYIADEIMAIANELSSIPLAEVNISRLEDYLFRLDIISFAAETDALRNPSHKELFKGISSFREDISKAIEFFQSLSIDFICPAETSPSSNDIGKICSDFGFQLNILLFILKGEVQKMGRLHLKEGQQTAFDMICKKLKELIDLVRGARDKSTFAEIASMLQDVHSQMKSEAEKLGLHGSSIKFLSEEIRHFAGRAGSLAE